ncbi:universal stress protein [Aneurinibacillus sp. REN35]|uniref:universal stress protein n=1 Tax=Aneurinibacillus sp. REN35 TaxID=3237286 RepID=UPI0035292E16
MNSILLAVDGSAYDHKSVAFINEKLTYEPQITVYAATVLPEMDAALLDIHPHLKEQYRAQADKLLIELGQTLTSNTATYSHHILEGSNVAEQLLNLADTHDVGMIIMGCRGLSNYKELTLGSVSSEVIRRSSRPVVIVK